MQNRNMVMINPFVELISTVIQLYLYLVVGAVVLSWLISAQIVNIRQPAVMKIRYALNRLTEPPLRRIRKYMPDLGGLDISPIILIIGLHFLDNFLIYYFGRL